MKQSSRRGYGLARLAVLSVFAIGILFLVSNSKPQAVEANGSIDYVGAQHTNSILSVDGRWSDSHIFRMKSGIETSSIPLRLNSGLASPSLPVAVLDSPQLTLNKIHVQNPNDPIPGPNDPQASTTWQPGISITYVISLSNSGAANSHVTVTDQLPAGFVFLNGTCTASSSATCPGPSLSPPVAGVLTAGQFSIPTGGAIELRVTGYYTTAGSKTNTAVASAKDDQGNALAVGSTNSSNDQLTVSSSSSLANVQVLKSVTTTSTTFPATLHYTITVSNTTGVPIYLGGNARIVDNPNPISTIGLSWTISTPVCTPLLGAVCPDISTPGANSYTELFPYDAAGGSATNDTGLLPGGASYTLTFDVVVSTAATCGAATVTFRNRAYIDFYNGSSDANPYDNGGGWINSTINTNFNPTNCPLTNPTVAKIQCTTTTGSCVNAAPNNSASWNTQVRYQVTVTNPTTSPLTVPLTDEIRKGSGTPTFTATVNAGDPHCVSGCTGPTTLTLPTTAVPPPTVTSDGNNFTLWTASLANLASASSAVIEYIVVYSPLCESDEYADRIVNRITVPGSYQDVVTNVTPEATACNLTVEKTKVTPGPIVFESPTTYQVVYSNLSNTSLDLTVRDALSVSSAQYGTFTFTYSTSCTATSGTITPVPTAQTNAVNTVPYQPYGWNGAQLLNSYVKFGPASTLTCQVTVTPHKPPDSSIYCQGDGTPQLINAAYVDQSTNYSPGNKPTFYDEEAAALPLCRNVIVSKTATPHTYGPGATVIYNITVENKGNSAVASFTLKDLVQPPLIPVSVGSCTPAAACIPNPPTLNTSTGQVDAIYGLLQPNVPVTFQLTVQAPQAGGSYPNVAVGSFLPVAGTTFYFKGDEATFLQQEENIQVLTPTLSKSFDPAQIGSTGTSTLTFNITNTNSDPNQNNISFSDTLPVGLEVVSVVSSGCGGTVSISSDNRTITLTGGQLINKHTCQIAVKVKAIGVCGVYLNNKNNFSNVVNLDVSNINQQLQVTGCPQGTPTLTKRFDPAQIAPHGTSSLAFNIINSSGDPKQTGISFADTVPAGLSIVSVVSNGCSGTPTISTDGHTITLTGGQLVGSNADGSGQHSCQIIVKVQANGECGVYKNNNENFSHVTNLDVSGVNAQLEVTGCETSTNSCGVKTNEISCKTDGSGGYQYTFTVTNNTGHVVTDVLLTPKPGSGITIHPQQPPLPPGGIAIGASLTFDVSLSGGKPGDKACFTVTLMTNDGECCTTEVCVVLPDCCGIAKDETIECNGDGTYTYVFTIVNTGPNTIEHIYLNPQAGSTMSQTYFPVSLKPGDTFTGKVTIKGAKPGRYCFGISLHTAAMKDCCSGEHCLILPECPLKYPR